MLTFTGHTDHCICVAVHLQQSENLLDVCVLFFARYGSRLTENRTEPQSLANGRGLEMQVLLLNVSGLALEGLVTRSSVNKNVSRDHTNARPLG